MTSSQRPHFHNAIILAKRGAKVYVVDENGNKLSRGHHKVSWGGSFGFEGKTGASEKTFTVDTDRVNPFDAKLARKLTLEDIVHHAADERIAALAHYLREYDHIPEVRDAEE